MAIATLMRRGLGRDAHHLRAAPGDRAHIGIDKALALQGLAAGGVDLGDRVGDFHVEHFGRIEQPLGVLGELEDLAAIGALALEDAGAIMQAMGQDMHLGVLPGDEFAVEPDHAFALIKWNDRHGLPPRASK